MTPQYEICTVTTPEITTVECTGEALYKENRRETYRHDIRPPLRSVR